MASNNSYSTFTAGAQTIAVTDCARGECVPNGQAAQALISKLFQPSGGANLDTGFISPRNFREIEIVGRAPSSSSVYNVRMLAHDLVANMAAFLRSDVSTFDTYSNATIASDAVNWVTIPGYVLNQDQTLAGAPVGTRMRPFGHYVYLQFPDGVGRVRLTANTAAGASARSVIINISENDAACLAFFVPFRDSSAGNLYGGNTTSPNDPSVYSYLAPGPYGSGVLAPGAGTQELIGVAFEDLNFNQALYNFTYSAWTIWYTEDLLGSIEAMATGAAPGPVSGKNLSY